MHDMLENKMSSTFILKNEGCNGTKWNTVFFTSPADLGKRTPDLHLGKALKHTHCIFLPFGNLELLVILEKFRLEKIV